VSHGVDRAGAAGRTVRRYRIDDPGGEASRASVKRVLITGMSGTGKSTVIAALACS
jgi:putative protein kinase ArgK-like GTPase of G3E family